MAIYESDRRRVNDPSKPYKDGIVIDYFVDTLADIQNLPGIDQISGSHTAYIISTKQVKVLTKSGWEDL